jgi:hypothetical protein
VCLAHKTLVFLIEKNATLVRSGDRRRIAATAAITLPPW